MKNLRITFLLLMAVGMRAEESPIKSKDIGPSSARMVAAAEKVGARSASKDISSGNFRILYFGKPWSVGKPLIDEATGYRVQIIAGCDVTAPFVAELTAYNRTMRDWHTLHSSASKNR